MMHMLFSRRDIAKNDGWNRDSLRVSEANMRLAARFAIEPMETRVMLSVTAQSLFDNYEHAGVTWVYDVSYSGEDGTATQTNTVLGPATAPDGVTATEEVQSLLQGSFETSDGEVTGSDESDDYYGLGANGLVDYYANHVDTDDTTDKSVTLTDTFSPYKVDFPASLTAGTAFDTSDTDTETDSDSQDSDVPSVTDEMHEITLVSETPTSITVPAGTFSCYEVDYTHTTETSGDIVGSTNTETDYFSPGIGVVELTSTVDNVTEELASFKGVSDTLAFTTQPTDTGLNQTITPAVAVALEDSSGNVDTNATGTITIALGTSTGTGTLAGTLTEPVTNGVATFGDLSINQSGKYTLSATSTGATGAATSNSFQIGGDQLVFTTQPQGAPVNGQIPVVVSVEDASDTVDASVTGTIGLTLNTIKGGEGATLGGTVSATLQNGVATFTGNDAPKINAEGEYDLTADLSGSSSSIDSVDSDDFFVGSDTLRFDVQPAKTVDPGAPIQFILEAENSEKKVDTDFDGELQISLNVIKGDSGTILGDVDTGDFVDGVATFKGDDAPTIADSGTYTLTMTPVTENESGELTPESNIKPITSKEFQVSKLHLEFIAQPEDVNINAPIVFKVALEDASHNIVTDATTDRVYISDIDSLGNTPPISFQPLSAGLVNGVADFSASEASKLTLSGTGSFKIEVAESDSSDNNIATTTPATSDMFKVLGFHLVFLTQPEKYIPSGQPITFSVKIVNDVGDLVTTEDANDIDVARMSLVEGSGVLAGTFTVPSEPLNGGIATFSIGPDEASADTTPGIWRITVDEILNSPGNPVASYTEAAKSKFFKIT
jgi:hypothetical protein